MLRSCGRFLVFHRRVFQLDTKHVQPQVALRIRRNLLSVVKIAGLSGLSIPKEPGFPGNEHLQGLPVFDGKNHPFLIGTFQRALKRGNRLRIHFVQSAILGKT